MKTTPDLPVQSTKTPIALGIDIGGSGIKGAPVNLAEGVFAEERLRIPTPKPSTLAAVVGILAQIVTHFDAHGKLPVGITFPGIIRGGEVRSAWNMGGQAWMGFNLARAVEEQTGNRVVVVNDADAAGYAEVMHGAAKGETGTVHVVTLGTGLGSALISRGQLVPNTEFGHIEVKGHDAELFATDAARERDKMTWAEWAGHLDDYFGRLEFLLSPDLFVVGGGVSKKADKYLPLLHIQTPIVPAKLRNDAGIVGAAALAAAQAKA